LVLYTSNEKIQTHKGSFLIHKNTFHPRKETQHGKSKVFGYKF
jgi:hypothetical protein